MLFCHFKKFDFFDFNSFMTEAVIGANQWTGFCMITASVMKELN